jgi:hypothetical protein
MPHGVLISRSASRRRLRAIRPVRTFRPFRSVGPFRPFGPIASFGALGPLWTMQAIAMVSSVAIAMVTAMLGPVIGRGLITINVRPAACRHLSWPWRDALCHQRRHVDRRDPPRRQKRRCESYVPHNSSFRIDVALLAHRGEALCSDAPASEELFTDLSSRPVYLFS